MRISDWSSVVFSSDLGGQRLKRWIAVLRHCIVECLSSKSGLSRDLAHAFRAGDVAQRAGDVFRIITFQRRFEIIEDMLLGREEIGRASCRESVCQYV